MVSFRSLLAPGILPGTTLNLSGLTMPPRTKSCAMPPGLPGSFLYPGGSTVRSWVRLEGSEVRLWKRKSGGFNVDSTLTAMRYIVLAAETRI